MSSQRVILFGDSILLAGLQASLGCQANLEIVNLAPVQCLSEEDLCELRPEAIIFELGSLPAEFFQLALQQANLLLVGIDPETNRAMFWAGQEVSGLSVRALADAIEHTNSQDHLPSHG